MHFCIIDNKKNDPKWKNCKPNTINHTTRPQKDPETRAVWPQDAVDCFAEKKIIESFVQGQERKGQSWQYF
jgi:hypothetical protein